MEGFLFVLYLGFIAFSFWLFYILIKAAVKNGIKETLLELRLVDKEAVRTIDVTEKNNGGSNSGNYI